MSAGNSAYSPLPQSNSDSDCSSEEELHVSQGNRIVNRAAKAPNSRFDRTHNEENNVVNYKPLDNDGDIEVTLNKFHPNPDEVSIVKPDASLEIFSTSRKICFVFSLLLCVFTTVAFLWILPCNVGSCPNTSDLKKFNFTWEENLPNIEIYGPITLVPDHNGNQNLLFLMKRFLDSQNNPKNGLKCLRGTNASLKWEINLDNQPTDVDCKLFDINKDGFSDCLIYGNNFLTAVDSLSGKKLWDIVEANKNKYRIYFKEFPLVIPDLDRDEVNELLLPCSYQFFNEEKHDRTTLHNNLVIISGKTGVIINEPLQLKLCSAITDLALENDYVLSYTCFFFDEKEALESISLRKVVGKIKNWPDQKTNQLILGKLNQHKKASDAAYVNGYRLIMKNEGNCPKDCHVYVGVRDEHESLNKTVYSFDRKNTYGMTPVVINNDKETGFVIKLWKWHSKTEKSEFKFDPPREAITVRNNTKNIKKRSQKFSYLQDNSKILENKMLLESELEFQRQKRTASGPRRNKSKRSVFATSMHLISESVIKIAFNPHLSLSNLTRDEIIQICKKPQMCQPSVYHQNHSILVAKLSPDGEEKLVAFNSKYIHEKQKSKQKSERWQLLSTIQVINL